MRLKTRLVRSGLPGDPPTGAVNPPIYLSTTFEQESPGKPGAYEYIRTGNPTREALEKVMAELEGGARGLAFASGMAALQTILLLFSEGDHFIVGDDVYGGTYRLFARVFSRLGMKASFVDLSQPEELERHLTSRTRAIVVETPTNPLLKVINLQAMASFSHAHGLKLIVDNTFMTPYFQRPLELGADIVFHSATKYLAGHSDVLAGIAVVKDPELGEELHFLQNATGAVLSPFDSYLVLRGIRTLALRMEAHQRGALQVAQFLSERHDVAKVYYPGLPSHPGHHLARVQGEGFGGMVSFLLSDPERAAEVTRKVKLFTLAESLGGVESLISIPARMTHASIPPERRKELGIHDGLIRLSVGIEDPEDLVEDLRQALDETL